MKRFHIVGWKTYVVAALAILIGVYARTHHQEWEGLKYIVAGCALIALRDAIGKILKGIDDNRKALNNVRAAIETLVERQSGRRGEM